METYERLSDQITDRGPWQQVTSGKAFYPADPRSAEVSVYDIANALSRICRYNGHLLPAVENYYVGQHALWVSERAEDNSEPVHVQYAALHHDSGEAYYGDLISQTKHCVPSLREYTKPIDRAVHYNLGVHASGDEWARIKELDFLAFATEKRDLLAPNRSKETWGDLPEPHKDRIVPMPRDKVRKAFLYRHFMLLTEMRRS